MQKNKDYSIIGVVQFLILVFCIVTTLFVAYRLRLSLDTNVNLNVKIDTLQSEIVDYQCKNKQLERIITASATDEFIESEARKTMDMIKEGEVLLLYEQSSSETSTQAQKEQNTNNDC